MTDEQRRLTYLRDNVEHLAEEKSLLETLIIALQKSSEEEAAYILHRLKTSDHYQLAQQLRDGQLLADFRGESSPSQYSNGCERFSRRTTPETSRQVY